MSTINESIADIERTLNAYRQGWITYDLEHVLELQHRRGVLLLARQNDETAKPRHFFTLGQSHYHEINGKVFDKDCVAVIEADSHDEARDIAFKAFGPKFCTSYDEAGWKDETMRYYPRGMVYLTTEDIQAEEEKKAAAQDHKTIMEECWTCAGRNDYPGETHIGCATPDPKMKGNPHGIAMGWFIYPLLFDPTWKLVKCANYKEQGHD